MKGVRKKKEPGYVRGICIVCDKGKQKSSGKYKSGKNKGFIRYKNICSGCDPAMKRHDKPCWYKHKKTFCENCGFIAIHRCQLDVDHIDGNKKNNKIDNYRTLCSNCHRLKTFLNRDWEK